MPEAVKRGREQASERGASAHEVESSATRESGIFRQTFVPGHRPRGLAGKRGATSARDVDRCGDSAWLGSRACTGLGSGRSDWKNGHDPLFRRPKHVLYHIDHSSQRGVLNGTWRKDVARCHRCAASPVVGACVRPSGVSGFIRGVSGNPYPCEVRSLDHQSDHNGEHRPPNRVEGLCNRKAAVSLRKEGSRVVIGCFGEKTQKTGAGCRVSYSQSRAHIKRETRLALVQIEAKALKGISWGIPTGHRASCCRNALGSPSC